MVAPLRPGALPFPDVTNSKVGTVGGKGPVQPEATGTTSFTEQLDELRRQLALRFVATPKLPLTEITDLLGFSHVQGFHRAFKRWTGQTPIQYRDAALKGSWRMSTMDSHAEHGEAIHAEANGSARIGLVGANTQHEGESLEPS